MHFSASSLLSLLLLLPLGALSSSPAVPLPPEYEEHLHLRPLPHSALLASFSFRATTALDAFSAHNYRLFPRSLAQILQHASTRELHLRFALGRWDAERWGAQPWDGRREGGTGVELWAWLDANSDAEADDKWTTLTNALSGLFCASLNFIDGTRTTRPVMSFRPEGDYPGPEEPDRQGEGIDSGGARLLHGVLPREVVCTENLTPFLKLLPCKGKAGIASLLDGHKLFDASWQSMAIDVRPVCARAEDGSWGECVLQIEQTIDMVLDIERSKRPRDNPIPRPPPGQDLKCDTSRPYHSPNNVCLPVDHLLTPEWTLSQVFGKTVKGTCLAELSPADSTPVCISVPPTRSVFTSSGSTEIRHPDSELICYRIEPDAEFEMYLPAPAEDRNAKTKVVAPETPLLYAERSFTGYGQEHGGVQAILTNPSPDTAVEFVYMESLPWFMRVYLHTLDARVADDVPTPLSSSSSSNLTTTTTASAIVKKIHYRPAIDRARGTQLELLMLVPPASTVFLTYEFEKSILRYTEYPPDANRGFDVAAAIITIPPPSTGPGPRPRSTSLRTTALLLSLPTPDFSMPYNVIIFTSTAIALAFGGLYNILVRQFVGAHEGSGKLGNPGLKGKIAGMWKSFVEARRKRAEGVARRGGEGNQVEAEKEEGS